ncbi:MAG: thioredoxin family protein [Paracoccus sp. (in: a-proteobacteria)]|uniref:thioredoxin family protein n=1 Tax=Paracoccus sp. TaxID=267 RepID=UPI00391AC1E3
MDHKPNHKPSRRALLISAAATIVTATGFALLPAGRAPAAGADERVFYTPGMAEEAMAAGEVIILDFWASWCSTCAAQERVMAALMAENPAYGQAIRVIIVDWDQHRRGDLVRALAIPRRSTLVALRGETEIGRIVAGTGRAQIKALFDTALAAARS